MSEVITSKENTSSEITWYPHCEQLPNISDNLSHWMSKPYILSEALENHCQNLSVKVLFQDLGDLFKEEMDFLKLKDRKSLLRKVFLQGDGVPFTYARVAVPINTYHNALREIDTLGENLLGVDLLYNNPDVTRESFEFAYLKESNKLFQEVMRYFHEYLPDVSELWARRSVFKVKGLPLIVNDIFLPTLPDFKLVK